jgi:hypothetical protein
MISKHLNWFYKQNRGFLLFSFSLTALLPSCEQEIEIPLPKQEPKYVINCLFQPFTIPYAQNPYVSIKQTIGFLDSLNFPIIDDAIVTLYYEDSLILNLNYDDSAHVYENNKISNFLPGNYHLQVEHNSEFIDAFDILPRKVNLKRITILPFAGRNEIGNSYAKVNFIFDDPVDEINYYEISITYSALTDPFGLFTDFSAIISEAYYPTVLSIDQEDPLALPFSDKTFNGKEVSIPIYYLHPSYAFDDIVEPHIITLHFKTISENYYKYKVSLLKQGYLTQADIIYGQSEPINVFTNIPQNYGVFAGYQSVDQTFVIENNDFIEVEF